VYVRVRFSVPDSLAGGTSGFFLERIFFGTFRRLLGAYWGGAVEILLKLGVLDYDVDEPLDILQLFIHDFVLSWSAEELGAPHVLALHDQSKTILQSTYFREQCESHARLNQGVVAAKKGGTFDKL